MMLHRSPTTARVLVAALLLTACPAFGGETVPGGILPGPAQGAIPLLDRQDCGPEGAAPCPKGGDGGDTAGKTGSSGQSATAGLLPVGASAKPLALNDLQGIPLSFDAKRGGRPALLIFWSLFCEPCKEELPFLDQVGREYAAKGLTVFTVNIDGENMAKAAAQYWRMNRFDLPVAMDKKSGKQYEAADAYGVTGTPSLFLIGRDGIVRWSHAGRLDPVVFRAAVERLVGS